MDSKSKNLEFKFHSLFGILFLPDWVENEEFKLFQKKADALKIFSFEGIKITILQQMPKPDFLYWKLNLNALCWKLEYSFNSKCLKIPC